MKLKRAVVFSADPANLAALCSGANALAEESVVIVLAPKCTAHEAAFSASKVVWLGERAQGTMVESYTGAIEAVLNAETPELLLLSTSIRDRCIAARLAVRLDAAVITDASSVRVDNNGAVTVQRNVYGGSAVACIQGTKALTIVLANNGIFENCKPTVPGSVVSYPAKTEENGITLISTAAKQEEESVDLSNAKRIVGVGRGIGTLDNLAVAESLAAKLVAEVGCTRPIAEEEHLLARNRYIGISGVSIKPELYLALGVSGQVQHMVGANDSKFIVAVNKDAKSQIFSNCDIGLVADLEKVLPRLVELF